MPYVYSYALKDLKNRKNTNLKDYEQVIKKSIYNVFKDKIIDISVYKRYFEFILYNKAINSELRQMGKEMVKNELKLDNLKKDYGYSTQLFKRIKFDIVIKNNLNNTVAIFEIKHFSELTEEKVKKIFKNMKAYVFSSTEYFVLITPSKGYIWRIKNKIDFDSKPDLEFSMNEIIDRYFLSKKSVDLKEDEMELIVKRWLYEISDGSIEKDDYTKAEKTLLDYGFIKEIYNSKILSEVEI